MFGHRELGTEHQDFLADLLDHGFLIDVLRDAMDKRSDLSGLVLLHAAGGDCWRAQTQAAGIERRGRISWNGVVVRDDAGSVKGFGEFFAGDALVPQVDQHQMVVGTAGNEVEAALHQFLGHGFGVGDDLLGVGDEFRRVRLGQSDRNGCERVHVRTTLKARENGLVHFVGMLSFAQEHASAGTAKGLVRGCRYDVGIRHRALVDSRNDQPGDVGDVADQVRIHFAGDLGEGLEVDGSRISGGTRDDELGSVFLGQLADHVVVQTTRLSVDLVGDGVVEFAGHRDLPAVGEMPAVDQRHAHNGVMGLDQGSVGAEVGHRTRVGLHVGMIGFEDLLCAVLGEFLDQVSDLLAFIVPFTRVAFGVFVGQAARRGHHHGFGDVVFRGDQADGTALAGLLLADQLVDLWIVLFEGCPHVNFSGTHYIYH